MNYFFKEQYELLLLRKWSQITIYEHSTDISTLRFERSIPCFNLPSLNCSLMSWEMMRQVELPQHGVTERSDERPVQMDLDLTPENVTAASSGLFHESWKELSHEAWKELSHEGWMKLSCQAWKKLSHAASRNLSRPCSGGFGHKMICQLIRQTPKKCQNVKYYLDGEQITPTISARETQRQHL